MPKGIYERKPRSKTIKNKISESMKDLADKGKLPNLFKKGIVPWNKGKKNCYSKDTLKRMSFGKTGKNHPMFGKRGEETGRFGQHHSKETIGKMRNSKIGKNNPAWKGGLSFEPYTPEFNKKLKKQIRERDNFTCQECGYTEKQLGYHLSVHHIDYNKKNNNPNNLVSLCRNCHMQTNFKRKDWENYFKERVVK